MKWNHPFELVKDGGSYRIYKSEGIEARLDFYDFGLRVAIYKSGERLFPTFSVCPGESKMPITGRDKLSNEGLTPLKVEDKIVIDGVEVRLDLKNFRLLYFKDGNFFFGDRDVMAYNLDGEMGKGSYHYLLREEGEEIFGLGDKTGPVNKAGMSFKLETFDSMGFDANSSDPLYKQAPFYICRNKIGSYGIYYDTYSNGEIDFGREHNNYYYKYKVAKFEEEPLVYYVIFGNVEQIVSRFLYLTGKAALPPRWSFRYCGSTMAYTDAPDSEKQLRGFLELVKKYDIDCGGFYLSSGYTQIGDKRCVFNWNKDKIPDPKKLAEDFAKQGLHFLPNVKPAFLKEHPLYDFIASKGWFLKYSNGRPAIFPFWGGEASYLDFTNVDAFNFWSECVKENLIDYGYEAIWNDNNEYDVHDDDIYAHGFGTPIKAKLIRPLFPLLMSMASRTAINEEKRVMAVSRSGVAGTERVAQTWTGDNRTSFEDFRGNHKMAMTMALSGYRFFGQDIGGFAGPRPSQELFIRWIQYGLFTPRFVLHSWKEDGSVTMPWLYPELIPTVQKLFAFRKTLIPYIYSEANKAIEEYRPLIKPAFLLDKDYDVESDNFMLGDALLSSPVFDEGVEEIEIDLPNVKEGWYQGDNLVNGHLKAKAPLDDLPNFFIKAGSVVPLDEGGVVFHVYAIKDGEFEYKFYNDDSLNNACQTIKVECAADGVRLSGLSKGQKAVLHDYKKRKLITE